MRLEDIKTGDSLQGIEPATIVTVVVVVPISTDAIQLVYAQRERGGLSAFSLLARFRSLLREVPGRRPKSRLLGPYAAHGQGGAAQVRWHTVVPRASRLHGKL
jgi:hypothetical protein